MRALLNANGIDVLKTENDEPSGDDALAIAIHQGDDALVKLLLSHQKYSITVGGGERHSVLQDRVKRLKRQLTQLHSVIDAFAIPAAAEAPAAAGTPATLRPAKSETFRTIEHHLRSKIEQLQKKVEPSYQESHLFKVKKLISTVASEVGHGASSSPSPIFSHLLLPSLTFVQPLPSPPAYSNLLPSPPLPPTSSHLLLSPPPISSHLL